MPKNLVKRGNRYFARLIVPTRFRQLVGTRVIAQTTGTGDLKEAERRSHRLLADMHEKIMRIVARAEENPRDPRSLLSAAVQLEKQVADGAMDLDDAVGLHSTRLETLRALRGETSESDATPADTETYRTAFKTLRGDVGLTLSRARDLFDAHQSARGIRKSTVTAQTRVVELFLEWAGDMEAAKVSRRLAAQWVSEKVMPLDAAPKSKAEQIAAMITFYNFLTRSGHHEALNPFHGLKEHIRGSKRASGEVKKTPRPWSPDEQAKLAGLPEGDAFRDVGMLCLWAGLRTDEAASLKVAAINTADKFLTVTEGKNENAVRYIPLHSAIVGAVDRMVTRAADAGRDYLFDLKPTGADLTRAPSL